MKLRTLSLVSVTGLTLGILLTSVWAEDMTTPAAEMEMTQEQMVKAAEEMKVNADDATTDGAIQAAEGDAAGETVKDDTPKKCIPRAEAEAKAAKRLLNEGQEAAKEAESAIEGTETENSTGTDSANAEAEEDLPICEEMEGASVESESSHDSSMTSDSTTADEQAGNDETSEATADVKTETKDAKTVSDGAGEIIKQLH